jgi:hypothetical protein
MKAEEALELTFALDIADGTLGLRPVTACDAQRSLLQ